MDSFWQGIVAGLALERLANLELPLGGPWKKRQQPLKITMASLSVQKKYTEVFHICGNKSTAMLCSFLHHLSKRCNSLV